MAQFVGIIDAFFKGRNIPCEKGSKIRPSGMKNNVVNVGRTIGRAQEFQDGEATIKTHLRRGQSWNDIYDPTEGELQLHLDTGQIITAPEAFMKDDIPTITGGAGGEIEIKFAFGAYEEIVT